MQDQIKLHLRCRVAIYLRSKTDEVLQNVPKDQYLSTHCYFTDNKYPLYILEDHATVVKFFLPIIP